MLSRKKAAYQQVTCSLIRQRVALVVVDPQNDFLHEEGVAWGVVGSQSQNITSCNTLKTFLSAAKRTDMPVFISPHYYFPHDHKWKFEGTLEKVMHSIGMFDRPGPLDTSGLNGSGADFVEHFKPYLNDGKTVIYISSQGLWSRTK